MIVELGSTHLVVFISLCGLLRLNSKYIRIINSTVTTDRDGIAEDGNRLYLSLKLFLGVYAVALLLLASAIIGLSSPSHFITLNSDDVRNEMKKGVTTLYISIIIVTMVASVLLRQVTLTTAARHRCGLAASYVIMSTSSMYFGAYYIGGGGMMRSGR